MDLFQEIRLGLTRSDYMVDGATDMLLQVELNTISTSSNGLACGVSELHRSDYSIWNTIRLHIKLRLDVDIELSELNWAPKPNRTSIGNGLQYQFYCLDVDEITSWN